MVEVFKTNVEETHHAGMLVNMLQEHFPDSRINFDLWDIDNILRVEGNNIRTGKIIELVEKKGFSCSILE